MEEMSKTSLSQKDKILQKRSLLSKIKGVNDHLAALLQKKIRIDLEIKRTKNVLTKLKKQTSTELKVSASLEEDLSVPISDPFLRFFKEIGLAGDPYDQELQKALEQSENLLLRAQEMEGYLYLIE